MAGTQTLVYDQQAQTLREATQVLRNGRNTAIPRRNLLLKKSILVAEASDGSFFMLRRAFSEAKLPHMLRRVRDGAEALAYVLGREQFCDRQHFPSKSNRSRRGQSLA